jgi:hypothetical protein
LAESQHCHFAFVAELFMCGPPGGGLFGFKFSFQAPSPEMWSETISGGEEVLAGKWGGLFLGYLLRKIFGGVIAINYPFGREHGRPLAVKRREFIALLGDDACDRFSASGRRC